MLSCISSVFILAALEACKQSGSLVVFILVFVLLSGNDFLNRLLLNNLRLLALFDIACSGLSSSRCVFLRNLALLSFLRLLSGNISLGIILLSLKEIRCAFARNLRW